MNINIYSIFNCLLYACSAPTSYIGNTMYTVHNLFSNQCSLCMIIYVDDKINTNVNTIISLCSVAYISSLPIVRHFHTHPHTHPHTHTHTHTPTHTHTHTPTHLPWWIANTYVSNEHNSQEGLVKYINQIQILIHFFKKNQIQRQIFM